MQTNLGAGQAENRRIIRFAYNFRKYFCGGAVENFQRITPHLGTLKFSGAHGGGRVFFFAKSRPPLTLVK